MRRGCNGAKHSTEATALLKIAVGRGAFCRPKKAVRDDGWRYQK